MIRSNYKALLPALLLLLQVATPVLHRMDCLASGRTLLSWKGALECPMPMPAGDDSGISAACCVFSHAGEAYQVYVDRLEREVDRVPPVTIVSAIGSPSFSFRTMAATDHDKRPPPRHPPQAHGRVRLIQLGVLMV